MNYAIELKQSIHFLHSEKALQMLEADPYWPKWDSPWWHMLVLHEMGETKQIPALLITKYVSSLNKLKQKTFAIHPHELPPGIDPFRDMPCHCQLGNVYQVLSKWGLDVDAELPWIRPWLLSYQMPDGGLNCDPDAYLVKNEVPSSMVGTIAVFEAILLYTPRAWTTEERSFIDKAAQFLMTRKLMNGSATKYNADERESAKQWTKLCFPRFYFYDVLRGLNALVAWSEKMNSPLPTDAYQDVVTYLRGRFSNGQLQAERKSFDGTGTKLLSPSGEWTSGHPATFFPLLNRVSELGVMSPFLSKQWSEIDARLP